MTSDVPYVFVIAGFAIFFVFGTVTTASSFVFSSLRWLWPYAWRVWLWGSIGFIASNTFLAALLYRVLTHISVSGVATPNRDTVDVLVDVAVDVGPLVVSAVGIVGGSVLGLYLAWRKVHAQIPAGAPQISMSCAFRAGI
jgi:hypothetical protein